RAYRRRRPLEATADQERRSERATEIAEGGHKHVGRIGVVEQVRPHGLADPAYEGLAQADSEAAADHDRLGVEQVLGGGDAGAERLDRFVDQLGGELVAALQSLRP